MSDKINIKICKTRISHKNYFVFGISISLLVCLLTSGYLGYNYNKKEATKKIKPTINIIIVVVAVLFFISFIVLTFLLLKDMKGGKYSEYPCYLESTNEIMTNDETRIPFNTNYYITDLSIQPTIPPIPTTTIAPTKQPEIQQKVNQENKTNLNNSTNINVGNVPNAVINSSTSQNVDNSATQTANRSSNVDVNDNSLLLNNRNNSSNAGIDIASPGAEVNANALASSNMSGDVNVNKNNTVVV